MLIHFEKKMNKGKKKAQMIPKILYSIVYMHATYFNQVLVT